MVLDEVAYDRVGAALTEPAVGFGRAVGACEAADLKHVALRAQGLLRDLIELLPGVGQEHGAAYMEENRGCVLHLIVVERGDALVGRVHSGDRGVGCLLRGLRAAARGVRDRGQFVQLARQTLRVLLDLSDAVLGRAHAVLNRHDVRRNGARRPKV